MDIRLAQPDEVEEIVRLERELPTAPHWSKDIYHEIATGEDEGRCLFVAWEGTVMGFVVGRVVMGEGEVESIAVRQSVQRSGLGRALLKVATWWWRARGAETIKLEVRAGGVAARRLYEGMGFMVVGTRPRYYNDPVEDAVLMRWQDGTGIRMGHV